MAVSNYNRLQYGKAGTDLSKGHGLFVKMNTEGTYVPTTAASDPVVGVVITPAEKDFELGICMERGVLVPARVTGAVALGDKVALAAGGKVAKASSGPYVGICQEAANAADDIVTIVFLGLIPGA